MSVIKTINILVDYDNIEKADKVKGADYIVKHITHLLCTNLPLIPQMMNFRFYGGWYTNSILSRSAQKLVGELANYPTPFPLTAPTPTSITLKAEPAYSLLIDPPNHLFNTFRKRPAPTGILAKSPKRVGCNKPDCGLRFIEALFDSGKCSEHGCNITLEDLVFKEEQKLVDVMLATDLIYYSMFHPSDIVVVVTSDEDLWPAILMACRSNNQVYHVQAKHNRSTPSYYRNSLGNKYRGLSY